MVNLLLIAAAVVGGFALLRIVMGSPSTDRSKREAERSSLETMTKVRAYEQHVEALNRRMKAAPDRQRELIAKKMEQLLKQKERLKRKTELLVKKS